MSQESIDNLPDLEQRSGFAPEEQVALRFAEQMTLDAKAVSDELWHELRAHFDEAQIVELAAAAGLFNFFNRFNDALQVEITQPGWPGDTSSEPC
ncbi:MAG TPA: hypothetical protein VLA19_21295 [Herpetosiphonaceae bacterium]|nr:hypothetical protein [Herpetosiphonaceae bacterium]